MRFEGTIVGLPRSRTYWFSRLLTCGDSHCFHDFDAYRYPIPLRKRLFNASFTPWLPHTGKLVIIERDRVDAEESFYRFTKDEQDTQRITAFFDAAEQGLRELDGLRVAYDDINERIIEIVNYLGVDIPMGRIESYLEKSLNSPDDCAENSRFAYAG